MEGCFDLFYCFVKSMKPAAHVCFGEKSLLYTIFMLALYHFYGLHVHFYKYVPLPFIFLSLLWSTAHRKVAYNGLGCFADWARSNTSELFP